MSRPDRIACVEKNDTRATSAPKAVVTPASTAALAAITARRSGTAANVVRMSPVPYSPATAAAPMAPAARRWITTALDVKASARGMPSRMNLSASPALSSVQ